MLADVDAREFDEWIAFRRIEPDPDERLREIVKLGFITLGRAWGVEISPKELDIWDKSQPDRPVGPAQAAALVRSHYARH